MLSQVAIWFDRFKKKSTYMDVSMMVNKFSIDTIKNMFLNYNIKRKVPAIVYFSKSCKQNENTWYVFQSVFSCVCRNCFYFVKYGRAKYYNHIINNKS